MPLTETQQQDLTRSLHRSHGSFELAVAPVVMALIGLAVDRWLGTTPLLTVLFALLGVAGSTVKVIYVYKAEMAAEAAESPWGRAAAGQVDR
ncbi:MAG: AtpZ/AtpI family protein [Actinomycetes bacterium]